MVGALGAYSLWSHWSASPLRFAAGLVIILVGGAALGIIVDAVLFRRLYLRPPLASLLGTYGLLLLLQGVAEQVWGTQSLTLPYPSGLGSAVHAGGVPIPVYSIVLVAFGIVVLAGLKLLVEHTPFGRSVRAVAEDRWMVSLLGINANRVSMAVVAVGTGVAALGGALAGPTLSLSPSLGTDWIVPAFAVVIVGGLGRVDATLIAAVLLGVIDALLQTYAPPLAGYGSYIAMFAVLLLRPQGLIGSRSTQEVL